MSLCKTKPLKADLLWYEVKQNDLKRKLQDLRIQNSEQTILNKNVECTSSADPSLSSTSIPETPTVVVEPSGLPKVICKRDERVFDVMHRPRPKPRALGKVHRTSVPAERSPGPTLKDIDHSIVNAKIAFSD